MRAASLVLMMMLAPSSAQAISLIPTGTISIPISVDVGGSLFLRSRSSHLKGRHFETEVALTRARIALELRWKNYVRIQLEPEFAQTDSEPADLFAEVSPIDWLAIQLGRAKVPFGEFELESRWDLPSTSRGLTSDIISDIRGFGGRRLGGKARVRLRELFLRPGLEFGIYRDSFTRQESDYALRLEMRPYFKGSELSAAYYARANATKDFGYGHAGSVAISYERYGLYLLIEGVVMRAKLVSATDEPFDATLGAGRMLAAYELRLADVGLQPYLGLELIDEDFRTHSTLGGAFRAGINFLFAEILRLGLELDLRRGQSDFSELDRTLITVFFGISLE